MKINARILIVDDEAQIAKQIKSQIEKMGYKNIDIAVSYDKAIKSIKNNRPDLILLDINLESEYTGIDLANEEEVLNKIPIIYITGCHNQKYKDELIGTNPKNYLLKPIRVEELEMNIALALGYKKGIIDIGYGFSYDLENRNLFIGDKPIKLSKKENILLRELVNARGNFVPLKVLEFEIWGNEHISKNALRMLVSSLRKKLNPDMIINVLAFGYKLNIPNRD
jgi:DNA-binding response OmpR family regulator